MRNRSATGERSIRNSFPSDGRPALRAGQCRSDPGCPADTDPGAASRRMPANYTSSNRLRHRPRASMRAPGYVCTRANTWIAIQARTVRGRFPRRSARRLELRRRSQKAACAFVDALHRTAEGPAPCFETDNAPTRTADGIDPKGKHSTRRLPASADWIDGNDRGRTDTHNAASARSRSQGQRDACPCLTQYLYSSNRSEIRVAGKNRPQYRHQFGR